jgi:hypothetical protein
VLFRCSSVVVALGACQGSSAGTGAPVASHATEIVAKDPSGAVVARVKLGTPCRATVDGIEQIVGTAPLVSQIGTTRWSGDTATNGTTFKKDETSIARMYAASDDELALFDPEGVAFVRATRAKDGAVSISDRQSTVVRQAHLLAGANSDTVEISGTGPKLVVTGTNDVLLAAILTAPEAIPEVRGLAACNRLFPSTKAF